MCYLPEWDMVNNNNKYTHNINGDINGMLTACKSSDKLFLNTSFNSWVKFLSSKFSKVLLLSTLVSSKLFLTSSNLALKNSVFIPESTLYLQFDYLYYYCFLGIALPCWVLDRYDSNTCNHAT